jgi:ADP-heptose:LPS heptosyltransferase
MDREALVLRNRAMAEAYHTMPPKHYIRRALLRMVARLPIFKAAQPETERILLIRPDHLGDMLLTTPALAALRQALPDAELHALIGPWSAAVLENYADLDAAMTLDFPGFNRSGNESLHSPYRLAWRTARNLRKVGYTHAVILRPDHWWGALVAHLAGIPVRIGYNLPDVAPFLTDAKPFIHTHAVRQNLNLLTRWIDTPPDESVVFRFPVDDADRDTVRAYLNACGVPFGVRYFCIHPGSGTAVKRWTNANWAVVADTLAAQLDATPVFTGGDHELNLVHEIMDAMQVEACVAVGNTNVRQLAALFDDALVVLGPDSGPLHLAAAVQTPTVALFGPADPVEFAQWGPTASHHVLTTDIGCRPCRVLDWGGDDPVHHPCVREIAVGRVLEAARRVVHEI